MDKLNAPKLKVVGWFGLGMSIVCFAIYIFKSAAGRDPSPALIVVGIATGPWRRHDPRRRQETDQAMTGGKSRNRSRRKLGKWGESGVGSVLGLTHGCSGPASPAAEPRHSPAVKRHA